MKQEERSSRSRKKILAAAVAAFGARGYSSMSLNDICEQNGISKGLIYHYFDSKDAIFLLCINECFDGLAQCLEKEVSLAEADAETCLQRYFDVRNRFFLENKAYRQLFLDAVLQTPEHLRTEITQARRRLDSVNRALFEAILSRVHLRKNVSLEEAIHFLFGFQEFFNGYFLEDRPSSALPDGLMAVHEAQCRKVLDVMLHGIAKEAEE